MKRLLLSIALLSTFAGSAFADCICHKLPCLCVNMPCRPNFCPIQIDPLVGRI